MLEDELPTESVDIDSSVLGEAPDVIDNGNGTSDVVVDGPAKPQEHGFLENLAAILPELELGALAEKYLDLIDKDTQARSERDKQYTAGLKKTGIAEPAPGGANFEGASRATHPVLAEAYVDFSASAIKELFPPNGPVKTKIEGKADRQKIEKAERKAAFMNWQLTTQIRGYRSELEKLLTQLPAGGSQYKKIYWDESKGRIEVVFVPIDNFILSSNAKNFFDSERKFDRMELSPLEVELRVASKMYVDYSLPPAAGASFTETDAQKQTDKIEGKSDDYQTDDQNRIVYEGVIWDSLEGDDQDGRAVPYLITIDHESRKVLALYRNWEEGDPFFAEIDHVVDYNFIPWRGALGIGLNHLIGGLSDALTGSLRALLDSALIATSQTALKLKGAPGGSSNSIDMTQVTEIDAMGADDIRKIAMPLPFPGPSPVLFELLGFLTAAAKGVVSTSEEKIADASNQMPVGTALALIEQGAKVFSAIHARLHDSQRRVLEIIHRLNRDHLPERVQFGTDPDDYVLKSDFEGPMDVRPVSDPNIFSEAQRFAQTQAIGQQIIQFAPVYPQVFQHFNMHAFFKRSLEQMKFADFEEILPDAPNPKPTNPVDENVNLVMGKPVKAFEGQDHQAHIQVHCDFAQSPYFGLSPAMNPNFTANMLNHIQDHLLTFYTELMKQDATQSMGGQQMDMDNDVGASEALAKASPVVGKAVEIAFAALPPLMQKGAQLVAQHAQANAAKDPKAAVMAQKVQADAQHNQAKLQQDGQQHQAEQQLKAAQLQEETKRHAMELQARGSEQQSETALRAHEMQSDLQVQLANIQKEMTLKGVEMTTDQHTALRDALIRSHTELAKTHLDNKTAIEIAEMNAKTEHIKDGESITPDKRGDA